MLRGLSHSLFSDWLHATLRRTHQIALSTVAQSLFDFLTGENGADPASVAAALEADWRRTPGRETLTLRGADTGKRKAETGKEAAADLSGLRSPPSALQKPAAIRTARRQARHTQAL